MQEIVAFTSHSRAMWAKEISFLFRIWLVGPLFGAKNPLANKPNRTGKKRQMRHVMEANETCHGGKWDMSMRQMRHIREANETCQWGKWDISGRQMRHVNEANETYQGGKWDMSMRQMRHIREANETCQWGKWDISGRLMRHIREANETYQGGKWDMFGWVFDAEMARAVFGPIGSRVWESKRNGWLQRQKIVSDGIMLSSRDLFGIN